MPTAAGAEQVPLLEILEHAANDRFVDPADDDYLEAAIAWAEDSKFSQVSASPREKVRAFLEAGAIYE